MLELRVRARVRAGVRDSWGTKRLSTKKLGYEMSGSRHTMWTLRWGAWQPDYVDFTDQVVCL